jgi:predicted  nucleic acid-binding Zn-ribbon protein
MDSLLKNLKELEANNRQLLSERTKLADDVRRLHAELTGAREQARTMNEQVTSAMRDTSAKEALAAHLRAEAAQLKKELADKLTLVRATGAAGRCVVHNRQSYPTHPTPPFPVLPRLSHARHRWIA